MNRSWIVILSQSKLAIAERGEDSLVARGFCTTTVYVPGWFLACRARRPSS